MHVSHKRVYIDFLLQGVYPKAPRLIRLTQICTCMNVHTVRMNEASHTSSIGISKASTQTLPTRCAIFSHLSFMCMYPQSIRFLWLTKIASWYTCLAAPDYLGNGFLNVPG